MNDSDSAIETLINPPTRDLGDGFVVRRSLPAAERRTVGPFVFFDQMGPVQFAGGQGLDVRPHPHIGLATVTYLFDGEIVHRDSLGSDQTIRPGEVNWMVAGRGIVHSERTALATRAGASSLSGIQIWVALPRAEEERAPSFTHHAAEALPLLEEPGTSIRLIAGSLFGVRAPAETLSPLFYADVRLAAGARLTLPSEHEERALYLVNGELEIQGRPIAPSEMVVCRPRTTPTIHTSSACRLLMFGGAPLDGPRYLFWNFVSSSRDRIEQAKEDWRHGRFQSVDGDPEFIPLPEASTMQRPVTNP